MEGFLGGVNFLPRAFPGALDFFGETRILLKISSISFWTAGGLGRDSRESAVLTNLVLFPRGFLLFLKLPPHKLSNKLSTTPPTSFSFSICFNSSIIPPKKLIFYALFIPWQGFYWLGCLPPL